MNLRRLWLPLVWPVVPHYPVQLHQHHVSVCSSHSLLATLRSYQAVVPREKPVWPCGEYRCPSPMRRVFLRQLWLCHLRVSNRILSSFNKHRLRINPIPLLHDQLEVNSGFVVIIIYDSDETIVLNAKIGQLLWEIIV